MLPACIYAYAQWSGAGEAASADSEKATRDGETVIRTLFLIHDLGQGGAEKVLVNLVNHLDRSKMKHDKRLEQRGEGISN